MRFEFEIKEIKKNSKTEKLTVVEQQGHRQWLIHAFL